MKTNLSVEMREKCFKALSELRFKMAVVMAYPNHKNNEIKLVKTTGKSIDMLDITDDETFWEVDKYKDFLLECLPCPYYQKNKVIFTDEHLSKNAIFFLDHAKIVWSVVDRSITMYDMGTKETKVIYADPVKLEA